jgi:hypothetical protein
MPMRQRAKFLTGCGAAFALALAAATPAAADAIDGNWCHADGRRVSIRGPEIITPGGNRMSGNYSRHYFSYMIPANETAAGSTVYMTLLDEYTVHLKVGEQPSGSNPVEEWKRCAPSISRRHAPAVAAVRTRVAVPRDNA